eukprot:scaffold19422_cov43-Prasinocladus_malaysianus.AAC.2
MDRSKVRGGGSAIRLRDRSVRRLHDRVIREFVDLSVEANKFIFASGAPVALGVDGSLPKGNVPDIYLSGAASFGTSACLESTGTNVYASQTGTISVWAKFDGASIDVMFSSFQDFNQDGHVHLVKDSSNCLVFFAKTDNEHRGYKRHKYEDGSDDKCGCVESHNG